MELFLSMLLLAIVGFVMIFFMSDEYIEYSMKRDIEKHFDEFYK